MRFNALSKEKLDFEIWENLWEPSGDRLIPVSENMSYQAKWAKFMNSVCCIPASLLVTKHGNGKSPSMEVFMGTSSRNGGFSWIFHHLFGKFTTGFYWKLLKESLTNFLVLTRDFSTTCQSFAVERCGRFLSTLDEASNDWNILKLTKNHLQITIYIYTY